LCILGAVEERLSQEFSKYLTFGARDRLWGVYCTCLGWASVQPGSPYPPDPTQHPQRYVWAWRTGQGARRVFEDEFQLHYITRGRGSLYHGEDRPRGLEAGSVFLLLPGVPHWYAPDADTGWDEHWVGFTGEYTHSLLQRRFLSPRRPVLHVGLSETILDDFQNLIEIAKNEPPAFQQRLGALVVNLLAQVRGFSKEHRLGSEVEALIQKARFRFLENLARPLDLESFARELKLDYPAFRRLFKDYTGLSPYQYFLQLKIHRARHLLQEGNLSVKEVAYELGFDNQYYFSRIFKKKTGRSPSEWQRRSQP
jgi:AraC-like DNA-binding protein